MSEREWRETFLSESYICTSTSRSVRITLIFTLKERRITCRNSVCLMGLSDSKRRKKNNIYKSCIHALFLLIFIKWRIKIFLENRIIIFSILEFLLCFGTTNYILCLWSCGLLTLSIEGTLLWVQLLI